MILPFKAYLEAMQYKEIWIILESFNKISKLNLCESSLGHNLVHNIIQIHDNVLCAQYEYGEYLRILRGILLVPHNTIMDLNSVMWLREFGIITWLHKLIWLLEMEISWKRKSNKREGEWYLEGLQPSA